MTCDDVIRSEIVEKYLHDELSEDSRESFERHYFDCGRCFGLLQTYRGLQAELACTRAEVLPAAPRQGWVWRWSWAPALAVLFIVVSVALWQRPRPETDPSAPARPPTGLESPSVSPSPRASLDDLSRVEPPRYDPGRLRGASGEADARFRKAMTLYQKGDYRGAIPGLRAASRLDPDAPHVAFFLGASYLLTAQTVAARGELRRTIALGDSPFSEEAHFYLAKASLQEGDVEDAIRELERTMRLRGEREAEALELVKQLQAYARRSS